MIERKLREFDAVLTECGSASVRRGIGTRFMMALSRLAQRRLAIGIAVMSLLFQVVMSSVHFAPHLTGSQGGEGFGSSALGFVCSSLSAKSGLLNKAGTPNQIPDHEAAKNCLICLAFSEAAPGAPVVASSIAAPQSSYRLAIWEGGTLPGGRRSDLSFSRGPPSAQA
jgi:hypothetical protein